MNSNVGKFLYLLLAVFWPGVALAYIDPGTGSILIQGIIAAIAAIGVTLKLYWHRFIRFFRRRPEEQEDSSNPDKPNGHNTDP